MTRYYAAHITTNLHILRSVIQTSSSIALAAPVNYGHLRLGESLFLRTAKGGLERLLVRDRGGQRRQDIARKLTLVIES